MKSINKTEPRVVKSTYYSNWGDRIGYPLASIIVKPLAKLPFVTPNGVTLVAFASFAVGCAALMASFPFHLVVAAVLIFLGYVGDDVDGQLARITKKYSTLGDYLDKVLDVLKIFLITFSLSAAVAIQTGNAWYLGLGFLTCFMFQYRYYIKLETMFSALSRDAAYFEKSAQVRSVKEAEMDDIYAQKATSLPQALRLFWVKNRTLLIVDEAEFAILVAIGALLNQLIVTLWVLAFAQLGWAIWRAFERGHQLTNNSARLQWPMRK